MAVNAFLTFYDKDDGATDSFRFTDYKPTESLAVDPTNPNTEVDGRDFLAWQRQSDTSETGVFPSLAAMWTQPPLATPSRSLTPSVTLPRRTRGPRWQWKISSSLTRGHPG